MEMSLSAAQDEGGRPVGAIEMDTLLADVHLLLAAAFDSDAIHYGMMDPNIVVRPNGTYRMGGSVFEDILMPYATGHFVEGFETAVEDYERYYYPEQVSATASQNPDATAFRTAFAIEFGLSTDQFRQCRDALLSHAIQSKCAVVEMSDAELRQVLIDADDLTEAQVDIFLERFCFWPRSAWDLPPSGFTTRDIEPWRFRRRLSAISRPLLRLRNEPASPVIYAVPFVGIALDHLLLAAYQSEYDQNFFVSEPMRRWLRETRNARGHEFNTIVERQFGKLGFPARSGVKATTLGGSKVLGDFDVVAWDSMTKTVFAAECKRLRAAKTVAEIADQLNGFRGKDNDQLAVHMRRVEWLAANKQGLEQLVGPDASSYKIEPLVVTSTIVPMQFCKGSSYP